MVSNRSGSPYVSTQSKNKYDHLNTCRDMSLNLKYKEQNNTKMLQSRLIF